MKRRNTYQSFKINNSKGKIKNRSKENTDLYKAKRWNQVPWEGLASTNHQYSARQHMTCLIATIKTLKTFLNVIRLMVVGNQKFSVCWDIVFDDVLNKCLYVRSWGCKFIDKVYLREPRTVVPFQQWWFHSIYTMTSWHSNQIYPFV